MMDGNDIRFYTTNGRLSLERETCSDLFFADVDCTNDKEIITDYKEKYELGSIVTARRTYNGEIITGEFNGFCILDKSNLKSIVGVVHTSNGSYDVEPNSIESVISEDEKIRKALIDFVEQYGHNYYGAIARASAISWLERQGEQKSARNDEKMISLLIEIFEVNHPNEHFKANPGGTTNMETISTKEIVDWLKSFKNRLKGE